MLEIFPSDPLGYVVIVNHTHPSPPVSVTNPPPRQNNPFAERPEVALGDDNSYAPAGSNRRLRLRIAGDAAFSTFATFKKKPRPETTRDQITARLFRLWPPPARRCQP